jgi:hypothetical protein
MDDLLRDVDDDLDRADGPERLARARRGPSG